MERNSVLRWMEASSGFILRSHWDAVKAGLSQYSYSQMPLVELMHQLGVIWGAKSYCQLCSSRWLGAWHGDLLKGETYEPRQVAGAVNRNAAENEYRQSVGP